MLREYIWILSCSWIENTNRTRLSFEDIKNSMSMIVKIFSGFNLNFIRYTKKKSDDECEISYDSHFSLALLPCRIVFVYFQNLPSIFLASTSKQKQLTSGKQSTHRLFYVSVRINKITHISTFPIARAQVFPDPCKASNGEETNKHKKPKAVNTPHLKGR